MRRARYGPAMPRRGNLVQIAIKTRTSKTKIVSPAGQVSLSDHGVLMSNKEAFAGDSSIPDRMPRNEVGGPK
jgi:hypothetical protein